jgi:hypothetical protein
MISHQFKSAICSAGVDGDWVSPVVGLVGASVCGCSVVSVVVVVVSAVAVSAALVVVLFDEELLECDVLVLVAGQVLYALPP